MRRAQVDEVEGCWCWQQRDGAAIFSFFLLLGLGIFSYLGVGSSEMVQPFFPFFFYLV
jgi:hypothetical protein